MLIVTSLTSCGNDCRQPDYPLSHNGNVTVAYNGIDFEAYLVCNSDEVSCTLLQPDVLKGFTIVKRDDKILISKDSFELAYDTNTLDKLCPFIHLFDVFQMLNSQRYSFVDAGAFKISEFQINGKNCKVTLEKENNNFVQIDYDKFIFKFKA